jgi:hypothetical protein
MRRTAFERDARGDTVHYTCTGCRHTMTKTMGAREGPGPEERRSRLNDIARASHFTAREESVPRHGGFRNDGAGVGSAGRVTARVGKPLQTGRDR